MSQFNYIKIADYVKSMRLFLKEPEDGFLVRAGFVDPDAPRRRGPISYRGKPLERLEERVNEKAKQVEDVNLPFIDRLTIAMDYKGLDLRKLARLAKLKRGDADLAIELAKEDAQGAGELPELKAIAKGLGVPLNWLITGEPSQLEPDSFIGVRVGVENHRLRERMLSYVSLALIDCADEIKEKQRKGKATVFLRALLEHWARNVPCISTLARQTGGRFHYVHDELRFASWCFPEKKEIINGAWSNEVEAIIARVLRDCPSVYQAWDIIESECKRAGFDENQYPARVTLYKRAEREREVEDRIGVDVNKEVRRAVNQYNDYPFPLPRTI